MTRITQSSSTRTGRTNSGMTSSPKRGESEKADGEVDHDYVPMNVYIDPWTMKTRFLGLSFQPG